MKFNVKALAVALGLAWGGGVFLTGAAHAMWPSYGGAFLEFAASIYPGYHVDGFGQVIIGTLYAVLDGAVSGAAVAWLYNAASGSATRRP